ncbi:MAG TPA: YfhO family protein [Thermoanaerobaculia bacterium]|nr:YfhO family protein [Thermoanaerobaculia bacterium]
MNPALPVVVVLVLVAVWLGDRWAGRGLAVAGVAGALLLLPTLIRPESIPSPAGSLARVPPWQQTGDPRDGSGELRDVTLQVQPWLLHLHRELRAGRAPFWNPHHYAGMPYWSNGSAAPIFPLHLLFAALPLGLGFVLLPWLRIALGGWGAWRLARQLGASEGGAAVAAVAFPLSGMLVGHLLFPMANALMLVPWTFWAVERLAAGEGSWRPLAVFGGLQLVAGHPETALHTCLLTVLYLLARGPVRRLEVWLGWLGGWAAAALLSAVQLVPLAATLFDSSRWQAAETGTRAPLGLVAEQMLRVVLPNAFGVPSRHDFWGPVVYGATAVYVGAATLALVGVGLGRVREDRRVRAWAVLAGASVLGAYHVPLVYEALVRLPLVGRAPVHRLIFGVELALAMLAAVGFDRWREGRGRGLGVATAVIGALLAVSWWRFAGEWRERGQTAEQAAWTLGVLAVAAALWLAARGPAPVRRRLAWAVPVALGVDLCLAHVAINPALDRDRLYPRTGAVRFLEGREGRVAGIGRALEPNAAMVYGLHDPRGDESIKMQRYEEYYSALARAEPIYSLPIRDWSHPRLDRLGVRWVVAGPEQGAAADGWRLAYRGADARVYERPTAQPLVRWEAAEASGALRVARREAGRWEIDFEAGRPQRLTVAECWDPGWRAWIDGRRVPVGLVDEVFLGVEVGPGASRLVLRYRPVGLGWGAGLTLLGLALLGVPGRRRLVAGGATDRSARRGPPASPAPPG